MAGLSESSNKDPLAVHGGRPCRSEPFPAWPQFDAEVIDAVSSVLASGQVNYWTGEEVREFEQEFANSMGTEHAVAVSNGTVALELCLRALGITTGDEVVVTSRSFIASASTIVNCGARCVFADVDRESQNVTAETIEQVLSPRTKGVIVVHLAGLPCDMDPIMQLASRRGLAVIEDCAQALGAQYKGQTVGSIGDAAAFSFCQDKIITTGGEGGMVTMNRPDVWHRAWSYKDHGKSWDTVYHGEHPEVFRWLHESIGSNFRMSEMQGAIGRIMLRRLPEMIRCRRRNAELLAEALGKEPALRVPLPSGAFKSSHYKFYAFVRPDQLQPSWSRDDVARAIAAEGVPCGTGSCSELYLEKAFEGSEQRPKDRLPVARELGETSLMFCVHPTATEQDMLDVTRAIAKVLRVAGRWEMSKIALRADAGQAVEATKPRRSVQQPNLTAARGHARS